MLRLPNVKTETKIKDGYTNFIWLKNTKKVTEIQIDLKNKAKSINNKQESIWTPLQKTTAVARLRHIRVVKTEFFWDCEISGLLRPGLFETMKYQGCWDWDSLRLCNFKVVETETLRDYDISRLLRLRLAETDKKLSRPRLLRESGWSLVKLGNLSQPQNPLPLVNLGTLTGHSECNLFCLEIVTIWFAAQ